VASLLVGSRKAPIFSVQHISWYASIGFVLKVGRRLYFSSAYCWEASMASVLVGG
jgi:hypothetical protein